VIPHRLVIGYDGSRDADHAIAVAGHICETGTALVVSVWDVLEPAATADPVPSGAPLAPRATEVSLRQAERTAIGRARDGAEVAREAGFAPEFDARQGSGASGIAQALVDAADRWEADLIVVGRRDMSRIRELVLGSVSNAVVHAADRPVLVVPAEPERDG
jgi:nucleotide-binding universal stress UspA family protein